MGTIREGHIVELKSGGPKMTVSSVGENNIINTSWFVDGILHSGSFYRGMLVRHPVRKKAPAWPDGV